MVIQKQGGRRYGYEEPHQNLSLGIDWRYDRNSLHIRAVMAKLLGPTGGYLVGFLLLAVISGLFVEKFEQARLPVAAGMALGMLVDDLFGTLWLAILMKLSFGQALMMGVVPYLAGDAVKLIVALLLGSALRRRLQAMRILV